MIPGGEEDPVRSAAEGSAAAGSDPDAQRYRQTISDELTRREARMAAIDLEIGTLQSRMSRSKLDGLSLRRGDVGRIRIAEEHQRDLRAQLSRLRRERAEAFDEVQMARQRRELIDQELKESGSESDSE